MKLTINGLEVEVQPGETVLAAARSAGIEVPTLCDHPDLTPVGSCRLCVVEVDGWRGEVTACTQPVREGRPYNLYHGTLEARPVTATTSKLIYTLVYDNSMLPDDAAREKDRMQRAAQFTRALENMKILAEGGTLPPAAPRGGGRGGRGNN